MRKMLHRPGLLKSRYICYTDQRKFESDVECHFQAAATVLMHRLLHSNTNWCRQAGPNFDDPKEENQFGHFSPGCRKNAA